MGWVEETVEAGGASGLALAVPEDEPAADPAAGLAPRGAMAGAAVTVAALALMLLPAAVAMAAIVAPGAFARVTQLPALPAWVVGGLIAFSVVAAGRVPAAALFSLLAWRRQD